MAEPLFVLVHTLDGVETVCECEGDRCYQVWENADGAHAMADECNAAAKANGWPSRYFVSPMPSGLNAKHFMD